MTERQVRNEVMRWHRWLGVGAALFVILAALTGFLLAHPEWLGEGPVAPLAVAADPSETGRLLRGTRWGVEESLDAGRSWRELPMLAPPSDVGRIHFDPLNPTRVFALGPRTLVTSADGGRVWEEVRFPPEVLGLGQDLRDVATGPDGTWLVLSSAGLLVSPDEGDTWRVADPAATGTDLRRLVHDLHTGHAFGTLGRRVAEGTALVLVFLTVSGLIVFFRRGRRRVR